MIEKNAINSSSKMSKFIFLFKSYQGLILDIIEAIDYEDALGISNEILQDASFRYGMCGGRIIGISDQEFAQWYKTGNFSDKNMNILKSIRTNNWTPTTLGIKTN